MRSALESGKSLSELSDAELDGVPENARSSMRRALEAGRTIESKVSAGGTAASRVGEQLEQARASLTELTGAIPRDS